MCYVTEFCEGVVDFVVIGASLGDKGFSVFGIGMEIVGV